MPMLARTLVGIDRGVHADDFAPHVEQRAARIPGLIAASV
jgi:hypothetical protein